MALQVTGNSTVRLYDGATNPKLDLTMNKSTVDSTSTGVLNYVVASFNLAVASPTSPVPTPTYQQVTFEDITKVREVFISVTPVSATAITTFDGVSVSKTAAQTGELFTIAGTQADPASDGNGMFQLRGSIATLYIGNLDLVTPANVTVVVAGLE